MGQVTTHYSSLLSSPSPLCPSPYSTLSLAPLNTPYLEIYSLSGVPSRNTLPLSSLPLINTSQVTRPAAVLTWLLIQYASSIVLCVKVSFFNGHCAPRVVLLTFFIGIDFIDVFFCVFLSGFCEVDIWLMKRFWGRVMVCLKIHTVIYTYILHTYIATCFHTHSFLYIHAIIRTKDISACLHTFCRNGVVQGVRVFLHWI